MTAVEGQSTTSERILDASLRAFAGRGIEATSLDSVAADVGVRKQTLLYWFPSKDDLVQAVIDRAVGELGDLLADAVLGARPGRRGDGAPRGLDDRIRSAVDTVFRLGRTRPELLALVREVIRRGPPTSGHLVRSIEPLVEEAAAGLGDRVEPSRARAALLSAGARVIGIATEAEIRTDLGIAPDLAWLRGHRAALIRALLRDLA